MKDSPAACATLGINLTRTKLAVFALSAAMAGVGGRPVRRRSQSVDQRPTSTSSAACRPAGRRGRRASARVGGALAAGIFLRLCPLLGNLVPQRVTELPVLLAGRPGIGLGRDPNGFVVAAARGRRHRVWDQPRPGRRWSAVCWSAASACCGDGRSSILVVRGALAGHRLAGRRRRRLAARARAAAPSSGAPGAGRRGRAAVPLEWIGITSPLHGRRRRPARDRTLRPCPKVGAVPLLEVGDVTVRFGGNLAVDDVSSTVDAGRSHRADRPERRRQDHAVQRHHRAAGADRRPGHARRRGPHRPHALPAGPARAGPHLPAARAVRPAHACARTSRWPPTSAAAGRTGVAVAGTSTRSRPTVDVTRSETRPRAHVGRPCRPTRDCPTGQARLVELARALATRPRCCCSTSPPRARTTRDGSVRRPARAAGGRRHRPSSSSSTTCRW